MAMKVSNIFIKQRKSRSNKLIRKAPNKKSCTSRLANRILYYKMA